MWVLLMCSHLYETGEDFQSSRYECETSVSHYFILSFVVLKDIHPPPLTKLRGLSPQANYTDRATAACRRS
jgi:hypothetical protein